MKYRVTLTILVLMMTVAAAGDSIELINGDRLTGELRRLSGGELQFETDYAGLLTIDWDQVSALSTSRAFTVELETRLLAPLKLVSKGQFLPILSDGRYRLEWDAGLRIPLLKGFTLGLQLFDNFDSSPPRENVKNNDFGVLSTFGWSF